MGEIQIIEEPEWKAFNITDPDRFRGVLRTIYENMVSERKNYIPDLNDLMDQEDSVELDIIQPIVQLYTFGEEMEYWTDAQEEAMGMNITWYRNDINHDIKLSFLLDQFTFIDELGVLINSPVIKIF